MGTSKRHTVFYKIVFLMLIVSVLPITILAVVLSRISDNTIRMSVSSGFENLSRRAAQEIHIYIRGTEDTLRLTATAAGNVYPDEWKSKSILRNVVQNMKGIKSICIISKDGQEIATSNIDTPEANCSKSESIKMAIKGGITYSDIYVSDILIPAMKIGVPIKKSNDIIGVLGTEITVFYLWDIIDNIKVGKTGHAYVVDKNGIVIAHPQRKRVLKRESFRYIPIIWDKTKVTQEYTNENGINVLGSVSTVPNLGWKVVVEQPTEEAFSLINKIYYLAAILVIAAILLAIAVGSYGSAKIVLPIKQLEEGVNRIARGDVSSPVVVESRDEISELAKNFNAMLASLKDTQGQLLQNEKLAVLGKISSKIAHEVRNPLEAIKGSAVYLRDKFAENELIQRFTKIIIQEVNLLNSFISEVLSSSKKVELRPVMANINAVLEDLHQSVLRDIRFEKISISTDFARDIPNSMFDPEYVRMAFLNIAVNAMEAMPDGGELKIKTGYIDDSVKCIKIYFQDNGKGIPDEIKHDIFQPFFTTKRTGTGLGLSYVYEIIKNHKGRIQVDSEVNRGTTFTILLPLIKKYE